MVSEFKMENMKDPLAFLLASTVKKEETFEEHILELHDIKQHENFFCIKQEGELTKQEGELTKQEGELTDHNQLYVSSEVITEEIKLDDSQKCYVKLEIKNIVDGSSSMCGNILKYDEKDEIMCKKSESICENDAPVIGSQKNINKSLSKSSNLMISDPLSLNTKEEAKLVIKENLFEESLSGTNSKVEKADVISRKLKSDHTKDRRGQRTSTGGMKRSHYLTAHKKKHNRFICDMCSKTFFSRSGLYRHKIKHKKEKNNHKKEENNHKKEYICEVCKKCFTSKEYISRHVKQVHSNTQYSCQVCYKICNNYSAYRFHLSSHGGDAYVCDICNRSFLVKQVIYQHMLEHLQKCEDPKNKKTHICNICGKSLSRSYYLKRHILAVHNGMKFSCDICYKSYSKKGALVKHMQTHLPGFLCNKCNISFPTLDHLKVHILQMHDVTRLLCDMCDKLYMRLDNLKRHILLIHNDTRFLCDICENSYQKKEALVRHIQKHLLGFECKICHKFYSNKYNLKAHRERYHRKNFKTSY